MSTPDEKRLDEVEEKIKAAEKQADEHGTLDHGDKPRFVDEGEGIEGDGVPQGLVP